MTVDFNYVLGHVKNKLLNLANKYGWSMIASSGEHELYNVCIVCDEPVFFTHIDGKWGIYLNDRDESIFFDEFEIGMIVIF